LNEFGLPSGEVKLIKPNYPERSINISVEVGRRTWTNIEIAAIDTVTHVNSLASDRSPSHSSHCLTLMPPTAKAEYQSHQSAIVNVSYWPIGEVAIPPFYRLLTSIINLIPNAKFNL
jgi:hypothetical protein